MRPDPEQARRQAREEALELMRSRPRALHLRGTGQLSRSGAAHVTGQQAHRVPDLPESGPATSVRGGAPQRGEWNSAPAAHGRDAGTGRDVPLLGQEPPLRTSNMRDGVYEQTEYGSTLSAHLRRQIQARRARTGR